MCEDVKRVLHDLDFELLGVFKDALEHGNDVMDGIQADSILDSSVDFYFVIRFDSLLVYEFLVKSLHRQYNELQSFELIITGSRPVLKQTKQILERSLPMSRVVFC